MKIFKASKEEGVEDTLVHTVLGNDETSVSMAEIETIPPHTYITVTIPNTVISEYETNYYVVIEEEFVRDPSNNTLIGQTAVDFWRLLTNETPDTTAPRVLGVSPVPSDVP